VEGRHRPRQNRLADLAAPGDGHPNERKARELTNCGTEKFGLGGILKRYRKLSNKVLVHKLEWSESVFARDATGGLRLARRRAPSNE
jgi:hypothetical protein